MTNPQMIANLMLGQLQNKNPQAAQMIKSAMQNGEDPKKIIDNMIKDKGVTPEQMLQLKKQAKQYGVPDDIIDQF